MQQYINEILKKQCEFVGADFEKIDPQKEYWFMEHQWTQKTENEFIKWLTNYLFENKAARNAILEYPYKSKKQLKKAAREWVFQYGWKLKDVKP